MGMQKEKKCKEKKHNKDKKYLLTIKNKITWKRKTFLELQLELQYR